MQNNVVKLNSKPRKNEEVRSKVEKIRSETGKYFVIKCIYDILVNK